MSPIDGKPKNYLKVSTAFSAIFTSLSIHKFATYNWKFSNWISWISELTFAAKTRRNMIILENQLQETDILVRFSSFAFSHLMHNSGAPVAFKTWWEHQDMVGIICPSLFGLRWLPKLGGDQSPSPQARLHILCLDSKETTFVFGHFTTIYGYFFSNSIDIFHKTCT